MGVVLTNFAYYIKFPYKLNIWGIALLLMCNNCFTQVVFNEKKMLESFFSKIHFEEIPYYTIGSDKPKITLDNAKDTIIEIFDSETYESRLINERTLVKEQWKKYIFSQKHIENRDLDERSFHLLNTNFELRKIEEIKNILSTYFPVLSIDTSELIVCTEQSELYSHERIHNQNFIVNKPFKKLSNQEKYNLRGLFHFGPVYLTNDKFYAITTYDIYHKWINTKGEATEMETGGGGIIIVSLKNEQKIIHVKQFSEY